jgi:C4-dicarboxylate-specific signal transduction histidine kinase
MRDQAGSCLEVRVEDSGPGIPEDGRVALLEAFVTTKKPGEGTGLGLAITQRIVHRHQGRLEIGRSETLGGASFSMFFPLDDTAQ